VTLAIIRNGPKLRHGRQRGYTCLRLTTVTAGSLHSHGPNSEVSHTTPSARLTGLYVVLSDSPTLISSCERVRETLTNSQSRTKMRTGRRSVLPCTLESRGTVQPLRAIGIPGPTQLTRAHLPRHGVRQSDSEHNGRRGRIAAVRHTHFHFPIAVMYSEHTTCVRLSNLLSTAHTLEKTPPERW